MRSRASIHAVVLGDRVASNVRRALHHAGIDARRITMRRRECASHLRLREKTLDRLGVGALVAFATIALAMLLGHAARAHGLDLLSVFTVVVVLIVELSIGAFFWLDLVAHRFARVEQELVIEVAVERDEEAQTAGAILRLASICDELERRH